MVFTTELNGKKRVQPFCIAVLVDGVELEFEVDYRISPNQPNQVVLKVPWVKTKTVRIIYVPVYGDPCHVTLRRDSTITLHDASGWRNETPKHLEFRPMATPREVDNVDTGTVRAR